MSHPNFCPQCGNPLSSARYGEGSWTAESDCGYCKITVHTSFGDWGSPDTTYTFPTKDESR